jgi:hypothetical protein
LERLVKDRQPLVSYRWFNFKYDNPWQPLSFTLHKYSILKVYKIKGYP